MVCMLVGYEYSPHLGHGKTEVSHPSNYLLGAYTCIDKNGIIIVLKIITITITSRSYRCNFQKCSSLFNFFGAAGVEQII